MFSYSWRELEYKGTRTPAYGPTKGWGPFSLFVSVLDEFPFLCIVLKGDDFEVVRRDFHGVIVVAGDVEPELNGAVGALRETCAVLELSC